MNILSNLKPAPGSKHKRKIIGRGGVHGRSSTRGGKGQTARSGDGSMNGFAGGQTPLVRLIPKRGFTNIFKKRYSIVNLETLERCFSEGETITPELLLEKGLIKDIKFPVKILADGGLTKKFVVKAHKFSENAVKKIKAVGGEISKI